MDRYKVAMPAEGEQGRTFDYPADAASLAIVLGAGGMSKLSVEQATRVKIRTVGPGDYCDDMPLSSLEVYLARGWVVLETEAVLPADETEPSDSKVRR